MAEITSSLRAFLLEDAEISAAFGQHIYSVFAPDTQTYPFAIIRKVVPIANYVYDGRWGSEDIVQIDVYDDDLSDCVTNAALIENKLDGYIGQIGDIPNAVTFIFQPPVEEWAPEARHFNSRLQTQIKWTAL